VVELSNKQISVDIEYGHIYIDPKKEIDLDAVRKSRTLAEAVGDWYKGSGHIVSYSLLIDNYTVPGQDHTPIIDMLNNSLALPDSIFLEGDFAESAEGLVSTLKSKFLKKRITRNTFLAEGKDLTDSLLTRQGVTLFDVLNDPPEVTPDRFRFALNFDIDYIDSFGERRVSCPILAAGWHAFRLGGLKANIDPCYGKSSFPVDLCISVLPINYLQVEASVRAFLQARGDWGKDMAARIRYVFY